ncbi:helix-turn-helix transcriptional regulator [Paracoccus aestuariivivens]|uniref:Histidine kinase n=1 Tax=Paracoccus aestuariivivens TaxID=1820333 RepID=A0A6L6JB77_9RHOB|nr:LuxR family transcriptional regulator [Paracoccus aestuariivivens]MTH78766.1 histidine kinase [Paracoccus aestuariivivens]
MDLRRDIDAILSARCTEDAWQPYISALRKAGFAQVIYFSHRIIRAANKEVVDEALELSTLPDALIEQIVAEDLMFHLPMLRWIIRSHGSSGWNWMIERQRNGSLSGPELRCLTLFKRYGMTAGIALSLSDRVPRTRGGILLVGRTGTTQDAIDALWQEHYADIELLSVVLHQRLASLPYRDPPQRLTSRQREALELTGIGFSTAEIAERLEVSAPTVEKHLRLARQNLGARTTTQAVLMATRRRQIYVDHGEPCRIPKAAGAARDTWAYRGFPGAAGNRSKA